MLELEPKSDKNYLPEPEFLKNYLAELELMSVLSEVGAGTEAVFILLQSYSQARSGSSFDASSESLVVTFF